MITKFKLYEGAWCDKYFWKVELDYLEISLSKIETPVLRLKKKRKTTKVPNNFYKKISDSLTWGDDDDKILITYNDGEWGWSATWNYDQLEDYNYEYQGEITLEPYEKAAKKFNL